MFFNTSITKLVYDHCGLSLNSFSLLPRKEVHPTEYGFGAIKHSIMT